MCAWNVVPVRRSCILALGHVSFTIFKPTYLVGVAIVGWSVIRDFLFWWFCPTRLEWRQSWSLSDSDLRWMSLTPPLADVQLHGYCKCARSGQLLVEMWGTRPLPCQGCLLRLVANFTNIWAGLGKFMPMDFSPVALKKRNRLIFCRKSIWKNYFGWKGSLV